MSWRVSIHALLALSLSSCALVSLDKADAESVLGVEPEASVANPVDMQLPVTFEINRGQVAADVVAMARTAVGIATFRQREMSLPVPGSRSPLRVSIGAGPDVALVPEFASGGVVNYLNGSDRSRWLQGLPLYRGLRYKRFADGIDLVLRGTQGRLEYDFDLAPHASVSSAQFRVDDASELLLQADGALLIKPAEGGSLRLEAPVAFQIRDGSRISVDAGFEVHDRNIGFRIGSYDPELPLVIDPVVAYTTLIGVNNRISVNGLAVDSSGDVIFTGSTFATDLPVVGGSNPLSGIQQVYVTKLDPTGANIIYSTYLPSTGYDTASKLVVDAGGNAYLAGITANSNFPVTHNLGSCSQSCNTGFVAKLDPSGKIIYSTIIGSGQQLPKGLAVDSSGEAYVAGLTTDAGLTTVNAYDPNYTGGICTNCSSGFFGKLNADGTDWVFSSYFHLLPYFSSNQNQDVFITALAIDSSGNFYIGGTGAAFTLLRPLVISSADIDPGYSFIAKFSADGQKLLFSTDLPALSVDGLQVNADGTLLIAGNATADFPYTISSLGSPFPPLWAVQDTHYLYAAAINPAGNQLTYATYLGHGYVNSTALGADGNFYIAGGFNSTANLPLQNALETDLSSGGFVLSLTPSGQLASSTAFGGHFEEQIPTAMAVDSGGDIFLASAPSPSGILSGDPLDPVNVGTGRVYLNQSALGHNTSLISYAASIAKISPSNQPQISLSYLGPYLILRNVGSADLHISSITYTGGLQKSWGNCGVTVTAGASCFLVPGSNAGTTASGTVTINSDAQPSQQTFTPNLGTSGGGIPPFIYVEDVSLNFPPTVTGSTSPAQTLQLTNVGASSTSVTVRANGTNSPIQVNSNCDALAAGASCTAQLTYAPTASSSSGGLIINSNSLVSNKLPSVNWAGLNVTDPLQFSVPLLSFETVVVGQKSLPHPFTLTNATNSAIAVPSPAISNSDFSISSNTCVSALQPRQTCAMAIVYSPSATGSTVRASLTLAGNSTQMYLVGTPMAMPAVSALPSSLLFGPVTANATQSQTISLSNTGSSSVPVNAISTSNQAFTESDNCVGILASQTTCSIDVSFAPAGQIGNISGLLWISLNGGAVTLPITLTGTSTSTRGVTALPASLDFGSTTVVGTTSASQTVTLTNVSTSPLPINPNFSGPFAASSNPCPPSLDPIKSCSISINFAPTQAGAQQGAMTIAFSDGTPSLMVPLTGTAAAPPPIVAFASQMGGSTSATVSSGQTATYQLVLTASAYFSGTVTLTCSGAPGNSTCTPSPVSIPLTPGSHANFTVSVATGVSTSARLAPRSKTLFAPVLATVVPAMVLLFRRRRFSRHFGSILLFALLPVAVSGFVACSSGSSAGSGGGSGSSQKSNTTPPGTYPLTLAATSGSQTVSQSLTLIVQ